MTEVISGVGMFTGVVLALVTIILVARSRLVPSGNVRILINDDESKALSVRREASCSTCWPTTRYLCLRPAVAVAPAPSAR